jgi:hypothetical protein
MTGSAEISYEGSNGGSRRYGTGKLNDDGGVVKNRLPGTTRRSAPTRLGSQSPSHLAAIVPQLALEGLF